MATSREVQNQQAAAANAALEAATPAVPSRDLRTTALNVGRVAGVLLAGAGLETLLTSCDYPGVSTIASDNPIGGSTTGNEGDPTAVPTTTESQLQLFADVLNATPQEQVAIANFDPATFQGSADQKAKLEAEQQALFAQLTSQETGYMLFNNVAPFADAYNEHGQDLLYDHGIILNTLKTQDGSQYYLVVTQDPSDTSKMMTYVLDQGNSYIWYGTDSSASGDQDAWGSSQIQALQPISQYDVMKMKGTVLNIVIWKNIPSFQTANEGKSAQMASYDAFEKAHLGPNAELARILLGQEKVPANCPFIITDASQLDPATLQANASRMPGSAWIIKPTWTSPIS